MHWTLGMMDAAHTSVQFKNKKTLKQVPHSGAFDVFGAVKRLYLYLFKRKYFRDLHLNSSEEGNRVCLQKVRWIGHWLNWRAGIEISNMKWRVWPNLFGTWQWDKKIWKIFLGHKLGWSKPYPRILFGHKMTSFKPVTESLLRSLALGKL